ncbi:hypothetical protein ACQKNX_23875 [Lysinibacillus sp. NPDC093712]|uniref:hypothetical protein n=1 Tax=Lysinibacillus sp. NPDC093712 TaxID=3390579 RepID=UPI003D06BCB3
MMQIEELKVRIKSEPSTFISYLEKLIKTNKFDDGEVLEIAIRIIKHGFDKLSDEQWAIFLGNGILCDKYIDQCDSCSEQMPWSNMYRAIFINKDYLCANCRYMENKIKA